MIPLWGSSWHVSSPRPLAQLQSQAVQGGTQEDAAGRRAGKGPPDIGTEGSEARASGCAGKMLTHQGLP